MISTFKDANGKWRWIMLSSNSFEDRDHEIVSQKALELDVQRMDATGEYGPLRWWHVPGLDLGDCDFNAMHGRILVESGTFREERFGAAVGEKAHQLSGSIGFLHPATEPDAEGVYKTIKRFERSLLPRQVASNPFVALVINKEADPMLDEKIKQLKKFIGGVDETLINTVLHMAESTEQTAIDKGVRTKEVSTPEPVPVPVPVPVTVPVPVPVPVPAPVPEPVAATKEQSLDEQVQEVRDAVYALSPGYASMMPTNYWAYSETVYADRVIVCERDGAEETSWEVPYIRDADGAVKLAFRDQWTEVERTWQPKSAAGKEVKVPIAAPVVEPVVAEKAKVVPPPAVPAATAPAAAAATEVAKPAVPPPAAAAPEDQKIGDMTVKELVALIGDAMDKKMADMTAASGKAVSELTSMKEKLDAFEKVISPDVSMLKTQMAAVLGEAPRAATKGLSASTDESTKVSAQSPAVQEVLKAIEAKPSPDGWLDKFVGGMTAAAGAAATPTQLVLAGGPEKK